MKALVLRALALAMVGLFLQGAAALAQEPESPPVQPVASPASATVLKWGADGTSNVPYTFHDPSDENRMSGFEYDIMEEIGRRLGRESQFVQNDWDGLIPGLQRNFYEMVICGIEMTPEHMDAVDFSQPYYMTSERIVVRRDQAGLDSYERLGGHVIGTVKDTLAERMMGERHDITVRGYDEESNMFADLRNKRLDAILIDGPIALFYGEADPDFRIVGPPVGHLSYGIAFAKGANIELRHQVDAALKAMVADGTLHRILARWNLWTPEMAAWTGDYSEPGVAPTEWQRYIAATMPTQGWRARLKRYVSFLPLIGKGAVMTLAVSACAMVLAVGLGLVLALARRYGPTWVAMLATFYIEIVRGTPLLIQILFIFYGLPGLGIRLSPFVAGVIGLGLNYAAYEAENYRAGLQSVARGQMEAATALNMTHTQALRYVVVPQAFRVVVPVMTNDFISLLKDSSLVSIITLTELSQTYVRLSSTYFDYFGTGLMVGGAYLLLGLPFVRLARMAERRLAVSERRSGAHH
ncbi:amino acid ABC transporter permease [Acetobacter estunensis NRIC 0472]|uniref:ABC transporter permease subunit n=1 Tax=Acetobacter estunensis TaxID=104097 RepID=A0A967BDC0_9PROT|nr:ABC transporter substrate-binding protein/permease [Acetobacter estunensis]NHO54302.1 ABC transporter permease subunit [Acetobacter estunensis]GBQ21167.1 amino acid ABC transporter permease [Acetobacter estunensis NRIC 0472]